MKKTIHVLLLTIIVMMALFGRPIATYAAEGICNYISGDNVNDQNYSVYASTVDSYLHMCEDGTIMQVQLRWSSKKEGNVVITYYSEKFDVISQKEISTELPIAGGFYAYDGYYYLLSGQSNKDESNTRAVFALTKYDIDWNKKGTAFLYGANTTYPFDAGSARFAGTGKYIFVRTCHEMYTTDDGYNHQANVTFSVDTEDMSVKYSNTDISNRSYGYCSHSFNQFIRIDGNTLFAADHGDAYPRSIALFVYRDDCSSIAASSNIWGTYAYVVNMLEIPGSIGSNTTKTSIGGLECSSSDYIIAGNSVDMSDYNNSQVRNIFIASIPKNSFDSYNVTAEPKVTYFTEFSDPSEYVYTPVLVKTGNDSFILLWSLGDGRDEIVDNDGNICGTVYYTQLNGHGEKTGKTYSMKGRLSDCQPVIKDGKLLWYAWNNEITAFYTINISNPSDTSAEVVKNGHDYRFVELSSKGDVLTEKCEKCGETRTVNVPTSISTYIECFKEREDGSRYYFTNNDMVFDEGDFLYIGHWGNSGEYMPQIEISDKSVAEITYDEDRELLIRMIAPGNCRITISQKYNEKTVKNIDITVLGEKFTIGANEFRVLSRKGKKAAFIGRSNKDVTEFKIPQTVKYKGTKYKVTAIAAEACKNLNSLVKVTIPKYVEEIGESAFYGCRNLKKITIKSKKLAGFGRNSFSSIADKASFNVPDKLIKDYRKMLIESGAGSNIKCK
ncbi:MAG: leucine-rich repeat domain-containing protein [Lachnospiraceae bacterium]|nr:leucine-rich repeat domain-containing protein [Lachnospiraceae bacterium]